MGKKRDSKAVGRTVPDRMDAETRTIGLTLAEYTLEHARGDLDKARAILIRALAIVQHEIGGASEEPVRDIHAKACTMLEHEQAWTTVDWLDRGFAIQGLDERLGIRR